VCQWGLSARIPGGLGGSRRGCGTGRRQNKHFRKTTPRKQTFPQNNSEKTKTFPQNNSEKTKTFPQNNSEKTNISSKQLRKNKHFRKLQKCRNKCLNAENSCILVLLSAFWEFAEMFVFAELFCGNVCFLGIVLRKCLCSAELLVGNVSPFVVLGIRSFR
jgi:hypothetical protein